MYSNKNNLNFVVNKIRLKIFETIINASKGHIGGAFSCADILTALYFGGILKFNSKKPNDPNRDIFIFSKGHVSIALYTTLGIARAVYNDPDILVFDEPISSLDQETEKNFIEEIKKFKSYKTIIIISHREEPLNFCDEIYKLKDKRLFRSNDK